PAPYSPLVQTGPKRLHCVVVRSDGAMDDPTLVLQQLGKPSKRPVPRGAVLGDGPPIKITDHRKDPGDPGVRFTAQYEIPHAQNDPKVQAYLEQRGPQFQRGVSTKQSFQTFGKAKVRDTSGAGLALVTDTEDPNQTPYWMRPSDLETTAWGQGMSPDDLQQQMLEAQQWQQFAFPGYPQFDAYGGFPNPFGAWDPYPMPSFDMYTPSQAWGDYPFQGVDEAQSMEALGVDPNTVVDGEAA